MLTYLLLFLLIATLIKAVSIGIQLTPDGRRPARVLAVIFTLLLNAALVICYTVANQTLLNTIGFVELPSLLSIETLVLAAYYALVVVVIEIYLRKMREGDVTKARIASIWLTLPTMVVGIGVVRHYLLSYCASGMPSDPRCGAVFSFL